MSMIFSCEDAAQQVLMSVCLSVCLSEFNHSIQGMHTDRISTRQYKTVQDSTRWTVRTRTRGNPT